MKPGIALIGPGRVGCAVSKRLFEAGYPLTAIISRKQQRAAEACSYLGCSTTLATDQIAAATTAEIILLAVPDDQIEDSAQNLQAAHHLSEQTTLIHFSGLHPAEIMRHNSSPVSLLSIHPLLPFADHEKAYESLNQCPCILESDPPRTVMLGEELIKAIGGHPFVLDSDKKPLYHAAACIASNYFVTLLASARDLLVTCGIESDRAISLLLPLVKASLNNINHFGPEQGLTGPIVRGDIGTVTEHIHALTKEVPELLQLYLEMGEATALIAGQSGRLDQESVAAFRHLFSAKGGDPAPLTGSSNSK